MTSSNGEVPQSSIHDFTHTSIMALISVIPFVGGGLAEAFNFAFPPVLQKRLIDWRNSVNQQLIELAEVRQDVNLEEISQNEVFVTTLINASECAYKNHQKEILDALRNAVLNSALPESPDETRQKIFVRWAGELSAGHIRILRLFYEKPELIPVIDLSDKQWRMNGATDKLAGVIEQAYPDMVGNYHLYLQVVDDLFSMGLITGLLPEKDMATEVKHNPVPSKLGKEFWQFIMSPLN